MAEKLRHEGFQAALAPMTEYIAIAGVVPDLASCQALIFSSAEAVRVFSIRSKDRHLPVLTVGEATAETARRAGFMNVYSAGGGSEDIVGLIRTHAEGLSLKKILHPCSEDTPATLGKSALSSGVEVVHLPVYKAQLRNAIPEDVLRMLRRGGLDAVTFFSARAAENFVRLTEQEGLWSAAAKMDFFCISARVAAALDSSLCRRIHVAEHPDMESVMDVLRRQAAKKPEPGKNRRENPDRRLQQATYAGNERRRQERRAHAMRQEERVMREKINFLHRSSLTFAFMFIAIVLAGVFIMAPEYSHIKQTADLADRLEEKFGSGGGAVTQEKSSLSGRINSGIEKIKNTGESVTGMADRIVASGMEAGIGEPLSFIKMFDTMADVRRMPGGKRLLEQSLKTLRALLSETPGNPDAISQTVDAARRHDKTLDTVLEGIGGNDLAAAALLLTLNEFRSNISQNRPYAEDLALLGKLAGNDPEVNKALRRLAPYAETGVMSRERLQSELKGLAADIAVAKISGQDISVQEQAAKRIDTLKKPGMKNKKAEAAVARARERLDQGDIHGAMRELQALDEASAQAAQPWMEHAAGSLAAGSAADDLTQSVLQAALSSLPDSGFSMESFFGALKEKMEGVSVPYLSPSLQKNGTDTMGVLAPRAP